MADTINLTAQTRTALGHKTGALRRAGKLPGVLYGPGTDTISLELDAKEATRILTQIRGMRLIDLTVDGAPHRTLLRSIQRDSIRGTLLHVDFYKVAMDRAIRVTVHINLVGEAPALKDGDGVVVTGLTEVEIECLPGDMVSEIDADISVLQAVGDAIHVKDLYVPNTVKILTDDEELVARVTYQAVEEEPAEEEAAPGGAEVEVIERGHKEEGEESGEAEE